MKTIQDEKLFVLPSIMKKTNDSEDRNVARGFFFDVSTTRVGRQSLQNRLSHVAQIC